MLAIRPPYRSAPVLALCLIGVLGCGDGEPDVEHRTPARPDIVLITLDTTRAERLGCYGNPSETSPHLDALAREGVRFDMAIAQAAVTPVSHASILTGLDPYRHGLRVMYAASGFVLPADVPSLAAVLGREGWATGAFLSAFPVSEHFGLDQGFDRFDNGIAGPADEAYHLDAATRRATWDVRANQRRSDETVDAALDWIGDHDDPLFVWIHLWDPHDPWILPPAETMERFGASAGPEAERSEEVYAAELFYMDAQIGRLLRGLRQLGRYDHALIAVVADHGQGLSDGLARRGWWGHRLLYQEQIRVPLVLRLPGERTGAVVPDLVRSIDIFPTVLEAVGVDASGPVDGQSLLGLVRGENEAPRFAYAEQLNRWDLDAWMVRARPEDDVLHSMMDRSWKLIYRPLRPERSELYHLAGDPHETRNLYAQEPEQARRLRDRLERLDAFVTAPFPPVPGAPLDEDALRRLEALGYVGGQSPPGDR